MKALPLPRMASDIRETKTPSRIGLFGDLPTRFLRWVMPITPWFLEGFLIVFWTSIFFLLASPQRRAVAANLRAMHPAWGKCRAIMGAWRVFHQFALAFVDAQRCATETGTVQWEIHGREHLDEMTTFPAGLLLVTAHMGNYDLASTFFASRFPRLLHTVRAPERGAEAQRLRQKQIRADEKNNPAFRCHYSECGDMLGIELAGFIHRGDAVAVQADRVIGKVAAMETELKPGLFMRLPKGPWALARATRCACFPLFVTRVSWRRYRITVLPRFELPIDRKSADASARQWAARIYAFASQHWDQWFVFEPMLFRHPETSRARATENRSTP